jgi:S-DNA-T family DNA segregation ATPase FtsK/SpoIIIE
MIDPKMLELSLYNGIPHLLSPVVTDPEKAILSLRWVVAEMTQRYKIMSSLGVRNIQGYNQKALVAQMRNMQIVRDIEIGYDRETGDVITEQIVHEARIMPYIIVVIDEMADLMLIAGKEMENLVQRLAQMARAAGIHIIMATQRPSVDVITGVIKANFPTRISYQVASKIDSRTILGEMGAEQLLGNGDMLYLGLGKKAKRIHGPFVTEAEIRDVVEYLEKKYPADGSIDIFKEITEKGLDTQADSQYNGGGKKPGTTDKDDIYNKALRIVVKEKKTSISYLQRVLGVGYNKAAGLIERMESEGILSTPDNAGKRIILVNKTDALDGGYDDE